MMEGAQPKKRNIQRPRSAYAFFIREHHRAVCLANPAMTYVEKIKAVAEMWRCSTDKSSYELMARQDRIRYETEISIYGMPDARTRTRAKKKIEPKIPEQMAPPESLDCVICMEAAKNAILKPCRHVCCCVKCANNLNPKLCPVCRGPIQKVKGFFIA